MSIPQEISHIPDISLSEDEPGRITTINPTNVFVKYPMIFSYFTDDDQDECIDAYPRLVLTVNPDLSHDRLRRILKRNGKLIKYIKNPDDTLKTIAVKQNGRAIKHIKNPSVKLQLKAVKQNGSAIEFIPDPCLEVQFAAVREDGWAISHIKQTTVEVQLEAVRKNRYVIRSIKDPCIQVQFAVVRQFGYTIKYIQNPNILVQLEALRQSPINIQWMPELLETKDPEIKREVDEILLGTPKINKNETITRVAELLTDLVINTRNV